MVAIWPNSASTNSFSITSHVVGNTFYPFVANANSCRIPLTKKELSKLEKKLHREQTNRKAMLDAKSRGRRAPVSGCAPAHRNLQTYDDAMAARKAARRVA